MMPSFSIILPTYNRSGCICGAIDSVLKQTYPLFELIVVDDGSTDDTMQKIYSKYEAEILSEKIIVKKLSHVGVCKARNEGLKLAKNEWIAYVDSDNTMSQYFLGTFANAISKNPETKNFYAQYQPMSGNRIDWSKHSFSLDRLKDRNFIDLGTYVHHKSLIDEIGGFDENMKRLVDWDLILRHCMKYAPKHIAINVLILNNHNIKNNEMFLCEKNNVNHIKSNINYWSNDQNDNKCNNTLSLKSISKIVCYTCITGNYDNILDPYIVPSGIDFICFSDNKIESSIWKWRPIPKQLKNINSIKQQRIIKICPHIFLPDYDISIWIDGNIQIKNNLIKFIQQYNLDLTPFFVRKHPTRNCIYDEAKACIAMKKAPRDIIISQMKKYENEKFPKNQGLVETNILLRKHNNQSVIQIDEAWKNEVIKWSHRDQLSFNYVCWKNKFKYGQLIHEKDIINNKNQLFNWNRLHDKKIKFIANINNNFNTTATTIAICNFNTTELTNDCIDSILKCSNLNNISFIILDNSFPNHKFKLSKKFLADIKILDNTAGKYINFSDQLKKFSRIKIVANSNGSFKHALSIQFLLNICTTRNMILFDSDTVLKHPIDFIDENCITIADLEISGSKSSRTSTGIYSSKTRFVPFIQYFNCEIIKRSKIKYFYPDRIHGGLTTKGNYYDTGASFYEDVNTLNICYKRITYTSYINHLDHGSWKNKK